MPRLLPGVLALAAAVHPDPLGAAQPAAVPAGTIRSATFVVSVVVDSDCWISDIAALSFGHTGALIQSGLVPRLAQSERSTHLSVSCSRNTRYTLYLDQGSVAGSTVDARLLAGQSGNGETMLYQLYLDPAYTTVWGNGSSGSSGVVSGIGSGAPQDYTVYGRILPQAMPAPDLYSSIITASLTF